MAKKEKDRQHMMLRGKVWYFVKMDRGTRYRVALSEDYEESKVRRNDYLKELHLYGEIVSLKPLEPEQGDVPQQDLLFGQVAKMWAAVHEVAKSTWEDYKLSMNHFILPVFGNMPIKDIRKQHILAFRKKKMATVEPGKKKPCKEKRMNNILVPLRCVFQFAFENELIEKNVMDLVKNLTSGKTDIFPLSMDEVNKFLACVQPYYKNFFKIAFLSGMRFGEMAALKWSNVDFENGCIKVRETLVKGEEKIPKTDSSNRDIKMSLPIREALIEQKQNCRYKTDYVFLNYYGRNLLPHSINSHTWHPALKKAGLDPRPLYQTRHTFATLMLIGGVQPGWVAKQMGHVSLKMIFDHYFKYIEMYQKDDGAPFMKNVYEPSMKKNA